MFLKLVNFRASGKKPIPQIPALYSFWHSFSGLKLSRKYNLQPCTLFRSSLVMMPPPRLQDLLFVYQFISATDSTICLLGRIWMKISGGEGGHLKFPDFQNGGASKNIRFRRSQKAQWFCEKYPRMLIFLFFFLTISWRGSLSSSPWLRACVRRYSVQSMSG